jgi:hypothetical protein
VPRWLSVWPVLMVNEIATFLEADQPNDRHS